MIRAGKRKGKRNVLNQKGHLGGSNSLKPISYSKLERQYHIIEACQGGATKTDVARALGIRDIDKQEVYRLVGMDFLAVEKIELQKKAGRRSPFKYNFTTTTQGKEWADRFRREVIVPKNSNRLKKQERKLKKETRPLSFLESPQDAKKRRKAQKDFLLEKCRRYEPHTHEELAVAIAEEFGVGKRSVASSISRALIQKLLQKQGGGYKTSTLGIRFLAGNL